MAITAPKGVFDILPDLREGKEPWRDSSLWAYLEEVLREMASLYNFREMRTPMFERVELFKRSVGESTDIVSKEMYIFEDKAKRLMSLRPEGTAPFVRAFLEAGLHQKGLQKLFYIGPMFRYERQQAGRYRQHHQFGAEIVGGAEPEHDAELIDLMWTLYHRLGLKDLSLQLNSLGDAECRKSFRTALVDYFTPHVDKLSDDSRTRFQVNPLRILDSKAKEDQALIAGAPSVLEFLEPEAKEHFEAVKGLLTTLDIPFTINPRLVRGLDYYNRTVFEVVAGELGAQNSIGAGGRYDGLTKQLGGPDLPALGFATGLERILLTLLGQGVDLPPPPAPRVLFIPLGNAARKHCFLQVKRLRQEGLAAEVDLTGRKLKGALRHADQIGAQFVALIGDDELAKGTCELKDMQAHTSKEIPQNEIAQHV